MCNKFKMIRVMILSCGLLLASCGGGGGASTAPDTAGNASTNTAPTDNTSPNNPSTGNGFGSGQGTGVAKPTQVQASDSTFTGYVEVTWQVNQPNLDYDVYRSDTLNGQMSYLNMATTGTSVYQDTTAVAGTTYYYWVESVDPYTFQRSGIVGGDAGTRATMPATPQILPPTNMQASDSTSTAGVVLTWDAVANAAHYAIYRGTTLVFNNRGFKNTTPSLTYTDTTAVAGTTYYYWVDAVDANGTSAASNPDAGTRLSAAPVMTPPTNVVASTSLVGSIQVSWDTVPGAATYDIYRKNGSTGVAATLLQAGVNTTTYSDTTAVAGVSYYYSIVAVDANGTKGVSSADSNAGVSQDLNVVVPSITTMSPTFDNALMGDSFNSNNNTVFNQSELMVGCNYFAGVPFSTMLCGQSLLYFDTTLFSGRTINRATLRLYPRVLARNAANVTYEVHPGLSAWNTFQVTYNTAPQYYITPATSVAVPVSTAAPVDFDVTQIVQVWANGISNLGFRLFANSGTVDPAFDTYEMTSFDSMEVYDSVNRRPQLIVDYQ